MNANQLTEIQFVVGGKTVSRDQLMDSAQPIKREKSEEKSFFKGYRVEGFKPGQIAQAQKDREAEIVGWERSHGQGLTRGGGKRPKPFDLNHYVMTARRTPLRSKPYELREAAELCKRMAEKEGWEYVVLKQVKKEVQQ